MGEKQTLKEASRYRNKQETSNSAMQVSEQAVRPTEPRQKKQTKRGCVCVFVRTCVRV